MANKADEKSRFFLFKNNPPEVVNPATCVIAGSPPTSGDFSLEGMK